MVRLTINFKVILVIILIQSLRSLVVLLCALALPIAAVINTKTETKIERREAPFEHKPFDTYGLPPVQQPVLPTPVYGAPAIAKYPSLPPERPPPLPSQEYGVPVLKYGPPKVHVEYGPPQAHSVQQSQIGNHHHHHQVINHGGNSLSFFEQIKQTFGFGSPQSSYSSHHNTPHASYGPPPSQPHVSYGPPPSQPHSSYGPPPSQPHLSYGPPAPVNHFLPPKPHSQYGPPTKPHFPIISKPPTAYGPPPKPHFASPKPVYGLPHKPAVNFKPQHNYGPPPPRQPTQQYGPPSFPKPIHGAGCDGWKPIPGPSFGTQTIAHSNHDTSIQSVLPDNSYLPPSSNSLTLSDNHLQVQPLPTNLQLPNTEPPNFNHQIIEHLQDSGLGLTNINVIKSEGIELHSNNLLDSYSAPPADSFAPNYPRRPPVGLTPPNSFPYIRSHGSGIQHGSFSGGFRQNSLPLHLNPPNRQPINFRAPVPAGLIESIGQNVLHQDTFGVKLNQQQVYLPPPSNEIPPQPQGLESLPLAPATQFHQHQFPKANLFADQYIYAHTSQCSHGPNLGNSANFLQSIPQLQTVDGIPPQPLDVSQSSSFEIAQNAAQAGLVHSSYEAPASGAATSIDALINTHEVHAPSSSYGPPPSGNPADSFAHGSQKSVSTVQIDGLNETSNPNEISSDQKTQELPGLSSAGLDIISAHKSHSIEIPIQGQHGAYSLQFQAASQNELDTPNHEKLLSDGLLDQILSAIEKDKSTPQQQQQPREQPEPNSDNIQNHPDVKEFVSSSVGQETLSEVKAE